MFETQQAIDNLNELVKSLLDLEDVGYLTATDTDECIEYLRKITEITGVDMNFDIFLDDEEET
jgi:regulator of sigma D